MTDVGESESSSPVGNPSPARRILYYLRKRTNNAASDDMIAATVFDGDKGQAQSALNRLAKAKAIRLIG